MKRFLLGCFLFCAVCALAQEQSSSSGTSSSGTSSSGTSGQNAAGKTPSGQSSTGAQSSPRSSFPGSTSQDPAGQKSSTADSSGQAGAEGEDSQESSSRDTLTDISPPRDDAKDHPDSKQAVSDLGPVAPADSSDVQEFHPWNPYKAQKDVDIGDYYFKRKNYKAALDRYKEALYYKDNDAVATYRMAVCEERLGNKAEARKSFEQYLKILPEGPFAKDARASMEKLGDKASQ